MKKIILITSAVSLALSMPAYASETVPDCDSLNIMLMSMKDGLDVNANWKVASRVPNRSKTVSMGDLNKDADPSFSISCPGFSATYDGKALKMKADSYKGITDHLYKQLNRGVDLYNYRWYTDPKVRTDFKVDKYSFDLERLLLTDGYVKIPEGSRLGSKQSFIPNSAVIAYRINGSELKPLMQNRGVNSYSSDFKAAKTIDIYHKNPDMINRGFGVQRLFIDKEKGVLEIYKSYDFPSK